MTWEHFNKLTVHMFKRKFKMFQVIYAVIFSAVLLKKHIW